MHVQHEYIKAQECLSAMYEATCTGKYVKFVVALLPRDLGESYIFPLKRFLKVGPIAVAG